MSFATKNLRTLCGVLLLLLLCVRLDAAPIDLARAKKIAQEYMTLHNNGLRGEGSTDLVWVYGSCGVPTRATPTQQEFYVFASREAKESEEGKLDEEEKNGFVIIAGDDKLPPVLGYSFDTPFVTEEIPPQLQNWLGQYTQWVKEVRRSNKQVHSQVIERERTPIAPLLGGLMWAQNAPYNSKTPKIDNVQSPVGCVATALAQIARYTCWPRRGRGEIKYTTKGGKTLYQKFNTQYDWAHMPNHVSTKSTKEEREAVANLMSDIGIAVQMDYKKESSGAYTANAYRGMRRFFRYPNTLQFILQDYTPYEQWLQICIDELKAARPIYYAGGAIGVAHAFVCDGYDGQGRFHFNWGWRGLSNGYFYLTNLEPHAQSTGGGGSGSYNLSNEIMIGFQPQESQTTPVNMIVDEIVLPKEPQSINTPLKVSIKGFWNYQYHKERGIPAVQIFDGNGKIVKERFFEKSYWFRFRKGLKEVNFEIDVHSLPEGAYTIKPGLQRYRSEDITPVSLNQLAVNSNRFWISKGQISFEAERPLSSLTVTSPLVELYKSIPNEFVFSVKNVGTTSYRSSIAAIYASTPYVDSVTIANTDSIFERSLSLEPAEEQDFRLIINGPESEHLCYLHILYDEHGGTDNSGGYKMLECFQFTPQQGFLIGGYEDGAYSLQVLNPQAVYENGKPFTLSLRVKASPGRGAFVRLMGFVRDQKEFKSPSFEFPTVLLKPGEERVISLTGVFQLPLNAQYTFFVYEQRKEQPLLNLGQLFRFGVVGNQPPYALPVRDNSAYPDGSDTVENDPETPVEETHALQGVKLFPNPVRDHFSIQLPEDVHGKLAQIEIYTLDGQLRYQTQTREAVLQLPVDDWWLGLYLLRVRVDGRYATLSFLLEK